MNDETSPFLTTDWQPVIQANETLTLDGAATPRALNLSDRIRVDIMFQATTLQDLFGTYTARILL